MFPLVVPHLNVNNSCVTHPYATIKKSFNLHVLSIPPAFVLSQDQTLQNKSIIPSRKTFNLKTDITKTTIKKLLRCTS